MIRIVCSGCGGPAAWNGLLLGWVCPDNDIVSPETGQVIGSLRSQVSDVGFQVSGDGLNASPETRNPEPETRAAWRAVGDVWTEAAGG